jgi:hypothetical protein
MANYLLLYHGGGMPDTDEQKKKLMAAWGEWMKACGENLVDAGNPTSNVKTVSSGGVKDFSGNRVSGYSIVKADGIDKALEAAKMVPIVAEGGSVDVYETFAAM